MDEILTAIRRAITDTDASESAPRVIGVSVVPPEHPVVDVPPALISVDRAPPQVQPRSPPSATSELAEGTAPPPSDEETRQAASRNTAAALSRAPEAGLLSRETSAAVGSAFNTLAHAVRKQNSQTLEDLVRETLYPRLTSWLDDNLPGLVERMVRTEIERIARGH
jgi:cell pole-organizing protein PopZ